MAFSSPHGHVDDDFAARAARMEALKGVLDTLGRERVGVVQDGREHGLAVGHHERRDGFEVSRLVLREQERSLSVLQLGEVAARANGASRAGLVLEQRPAPFERVPAGTRVSLVVSAERR